MPRPSLDDFASDAYDETERLLDDHVPPPPATPSSRWPLFSLLSRQQRLLCLVPAIISSVVAGGIAPLMTIAIGHSFDAFSDFSTTHNGPKLMQRITAAALQLVGLAIGSFLLSSLTSFLWITTGENNVLALRKRVYASIAARDISWFDTTEEPKDAQGPVGAGGLMAQFAKDANEVRAASSLATGRIIEYLTTCIACLILALSRSYSLTLIILLAVPVLVVIQFASQLFAGPLLNIERQQSAVAATLVDRAVTGINTVKAFNAQGHEQRALATVLGRIETAVWKLVAIWGLTSGLAQFVMMGMFVQGFWFGAHVVRTGAIGAGDVMAVFWACLMATTNLQLCIPQFIQLAKGKSALIALLELVDEQPDIPHSVRSKRCRGDILFRDIAFSYPARPNVPVLRDITLSLPANKLTFIVGTSGSGKSTIAHLLAGLYAVQAGTITVDDGAVDLSELDIAVVGQGAASTLFDMNILENVAVGRGEITPEDVRFVCKLVLLHDFVMGLPNGYDTVLGNGGASLSGGQKQRLALARAILRNPDVLVFDEATSALDPTSRVLVFEAIRRYRNGQTTLVITHDLSQIAKDDFVYVLKEGCVVENGLRADLEGFPFGVFGDLVTIPLTYGHDSPSEKDETLPNSTGQSSADVDNLTFSSRSHPFGQFFLSTISSAPSAHTRTSKITSSPFLPNINGFSKGRTPAPWKPLPAPSTVFTRATGFSMSPESEKINWQSDLKVRVIPQSTDAPDHIPSIWQLVQDIYPTIPHKPVVAVGLFVCLLSGSCTPVFSFLLSRLLFEVSIGAQNTQVINKYGFIVLGVAAADGLLMGLKYFLMQSTAMSWVTRMRGLGFARVLRQDRPWFDRDHEGGDLARILITDGDDARELLTGTVGQLLVVGALFGVGMVWAVLAGWQLALAGFAVVPVFAMAMAAQARLSSTCEARNKRAREEIGMRYYETIANIRGIRCMRLESVFRDQFDKAADRALHVARRGAFIEGCTFGLACGLIYLAEALLFYFGAVLIASGTYSYLQMVQVLNLVVFTVTIGSQLMAFTQRIAKAIHATRDLSELLHLPTRTNETDGFLRPALDGAITFHDVGFSYPGRPEAPVLRNISLEIQPGECVAIVGTSGSGKSTIAALLQRLYEPTYGAISVGSIRVRSTDVAHLREQISVVSQHPTLFDATIAENIAYGSEGLSDKDIRRAAEAANVHEFIVGLPQGYQTPVGENATLISGGQAQRLQIARALARPSKILVLDECTSALDDVNQAAILETIRHAKVGRTTLMITHKLPVMQLCDRVLVVHEGRIAEEGRFEELIARKGIFANLVRAGELAEL
ncbi:p-loop containing nucleoside triphosphate hydrolase protein [Mycena indigotica]|uniref:p-loop containing nucleoside triphosphate hydrolase protein n=1 Tax=Mycena indigotica TaxID=2126181 RepID=A0A8H6S8Y1_9AGAR|nr:p-loop containing nucleoside triphosphate hydrolase protein [Mycena indigotica]KAF7295018.1 p-loop containing nucleoside triphosphate hydrolase protein [Mycena indigotica]